MYFKNERGQEFIRTGEFISNGERQVTLDKIKYNNLYQLIFNFSDNIKLLRVIVKDMQIFYARLASKRAGIKHTASVSTPHRVSTKESAYFNIVGINVQLNKIRQEIEFMLKQESTTEIVEA